MNNTNSYKSYLKSPFKSIKHTTYFDSYDHLFNQYRNKEITFVEIGVLGGGSLFMWRDYFGPKARIIGIDLNPDAKKWEENGFEIFIGSQSDTNFWNDFTAKVGGIDVVLDDGGHTYEQQIITTESLLDAVNDGGVLVVEDTHTSYMSGFGPIRHSFIEYVKVRIDAVNHRFKGLPDDRGENRFWSIEILESIVAFKVNTKAVKLRSEPTSNDGKDDLAVDFRYPDNATIKKLRILNRALGIFKNLPFLRTAAFFVRKVIVSRKFAAKKYFK
jgi:hypothetical protein